jgi:hypothetical protein
VADQFEFFTPVGTRAVTVAALAYRVHTQQGALDYRVISVLRCAGVLTHALAVPIADLICRSTACTPQEFLSRHAYTAKGLVHRMNWFCHEEQLARQRPVVDFGLGQTTIECNNHGFA